MIAVKTNLEGFGKYEKAAREAIPDALGTTAENGAGFIATTVLGRGALGKSSEPGMPPNRQSGELQNSITGFYVGGFTARIAATAPHAKIQEFGGTIRAKKGKFLPIPISKKAKAASRNGLGPRAAFGDSLTFIPSKKGGGVLVKNVGGKRARTEIHYVLKKQVTLAARPYMRPGSKRWKETGEPQRVFSSAFTRAVIARIGQGDLT